MIVGSCFTCFASALRVGRGWYLVLGVGVGGRGVGWVCSVKRTSTGTPCYLGIIRDSVPPQKLQPKKARLLCTKECCVHVVAATYCVEHSDAL
jgi:hypothetical protein